MTGHYSGTLRAVLARILDGNDYVVEFSDVGIEVRVLGVSTAIAHVAPGQFSAPVASSPAAPSTPVAAAASENAVPSPAPAAKPSAPALPTAKPVPPLSNYLTANEPGATVPAANSP